VKQPELIEKIKEEGRKFYGNQYFMEIKIQEAE